MIQKKGLFRMILRFSFSEEEFIVFSGDNRMEGRGRSRIKVQERMARVNAMVAR